MNKYETVFIVKTDITQENLTEVVNKIKEFIGTNGLISDTTDVVIKRLAYEIKNKKEGHYYIIEFECNPETIYELERLYRITEEILKFIVIKKSE